MDTESNTSRSLTLALQDLCPMFNNVVFRQIIESYIKQARDFLTGPKRKSDKLLKPPNRNIYYSNSCLKYYYFCHQYKDYFEAVST